MGFQIRNDKGEPVVMKVLDQEACTLWGEENDPKYWASPIKIIPKPSDEEGPEALQKWKDQYGGQYQQASKKMSHNWFDQVGWLIHEGADSWDKLLEIYLAPYEKMVTDIEISCPDEKDEVRPMIMESAPVKPTVELIELWRSKGYTPHPVKDY